MDRQQLPTLEDVARKADVSTATVSRCLSKPETVKGSTRERVLNIVRELGYTPNFGARVMASRRTGTIGAVIPTMDNAIFAKGIQAFQEEISRRGANLLVASSSYEKAREAEQIRSLISRGVDGLLLIGDARSPDVYDYLDKRLVPYVLAWNYRARAAHTYVGFDNAQAAYDMTCLVIEHGHRRIGMIAGITDGNDRALHRLQGVRRAIADHGIDESDFFVTEAPYGLEAAGDALDLIADLHPGATAVICGNDVLAVGAILRAKAKGLCVPADLSVTGFDNIELSTVVEPGVTTVHVPHRRMGTSAAAVLFAAMGEQKTRSKKFKTHIVERASLTAPGSAR